MFLPLSTLVKLLGEKKGFLSLRCFFILSFFIFSLRMKVLVASFCPFVSLWFSSFLLPLLFFFEGRIFLLISSVFLSTLHFFICSSPFFFFTLFSLCFSLSSLFFENMFFLFHFPSGSSCFVSSLSFLFCLLSHLQFQNFEPKTIRIEMSTWFCSIPFVDFLFSETNKSIFEKCIVLNFQLCFKPVLHSSSVSPLFLTPFFQCTVLHSAGLARHSFNDWTQKRKGRSKLYETSCTASGQRLNTFKAHSRVRAKTFSNAN